MITDYGGRHTLAPNRFPDPRGGQNGHRPKSERRRPRLVHGLRPRRRPQLGRHGLYPARRRQHSGRHPHRPRLYGGLLGRRHAGRSAHPVRARGTRGGVVLSLDPTDTEGSVDKGVTDYADLLKGRVFLEVQGHVPWETIQAANEGVKRVGGAVADVRPPSPTPTKTPHLSPASVAQAKPQGETVIVPRTVRGGGRVESSASVVIIGDVNAGAEVVAEDDIIVLGTLRGLAHAGSSGNDKAFIWGAAHPLTATSHRQRVGPGGRGRAERQRPRDGAACERADCFAALGALGAPARRD